MSNAFDIFGSKFGKLAPGMCRLSMDGRIAVKTDSGYKTYNIKTGRLVNCSSFVLDAGDDMFFCLPANKVSKGDIILVGGKPKCVITPGKDRIEVLSYEDNSIETIVPERHMFMGDVYFFSKIVSIFGNGVGKGGSKTGNKIMKYMMLSQMMGGGAGTNTGGLSGLNNVLPLLMMGGGNVGGFFDGMFDFDDTDDEPAKDKDEVEDDDLEIEDLF